MTQYPAFAGCGVAAPFKLGSGGHSFQLFACRQNASGFSNTTLRMSASMPSGGVRQVWHVYSNVEQVFVFDAPNRVRVLARGDELTADPVVPGFRIALADLFPLAEPAP